MQALGRAHSRAGIRRPGGSQVVDPDAAATQVTRRRVAENPAHVWGTARPRPAVTWPFTAQTGGHAFPTQARHRRRLATSSRLGREVNGPDHLHAAGAPLPQARRVSALPAGAPSGLYPCFHGVGRRTPLSSSPGDAWAGRQRPVAHARPMTAADCRSPRPPDDGDGAAGSLPRRGIVARRPSSPKGRHDRHRREPCFCYTPGAALIAVSHCGPVPGRAAGALAAAAPTLVQH